VRPTAGENARKRSCEFAEAAFHGSRLAEAAGAASSNGDLDVWWQISDVVAEGHPSARRGGAAGRGKGNPDSGKTCPYCKEKGQSQREVVAKNVDSDECVYCLALVSYDDHDVIGHQVKGGFHDGIGHRVKVGFHDSIGDQDEFLCRPCDDELVMAIGGGTRSPECDVDGFLMLDGGSDEHCAGRSFAKHSVAEETSSKLVATQKQKISLDDESQVPSAIGGQVACRANLKIGPIARDLRSTGGVFDAGFDVVYSRSDGCFVGYTKPTKKCAKRAQMGKRLAMSRSPNAAMGIVAANEDVEMKGEGAVQARGVGFVGVLRRGSRGKPSGGGWAPKQARGPEGAELGPGGCRADLLRARLRELGAAICGAKEQLWTRLKQAEVNHMQARVVEAPCTPTEVERGQREVIGHAVFKKWYPACVFGLGREGPRVNQPIYGSSARDELIFFDWAFNGAKDTENLCNEGDKGLGTSLVTADRSTGHLYGDALGSQAAGDRATKQLVRFMKQLAYRSLSSGQRVQAEMSSGVKLTPHSPLWPFVAHHAANVANWFSRGVDGYTSHFAVYGVNYTGVVAPFAEAVMARVPRSMS
ncbi:unnamed protein product, partial [Prorocentrum cordatum]